MAEGISGKNPMEGSDHIRYQEEYKKSAQMFEDALDQYGKSKNMNQKAEFKQVMDQALGTLNQSAQGLVRKDLQEQNEQIAKDYQNFQKHPDDSSASAKLRGDLEKAKRSIE